MCVISKINKMQVFFFFVRNWLDWIICHWLPWIWRASWGKVTMFTKIVVNAIELFDWKLRFFFSFYTNKLSKMHCNLCTCLNWHYTQVTSTNFIVNTSEGFFFFAIKGKWPFQKPLFCLAKEQKYSIQITRLVKLYLPLAAGVCVGINLCNK